MNRLNLSNKLIRTNLILAIIHLIAALILLSLALFKSVTTDDVVITMGNSKWTITPKTLVLLSVAFLFITSLVHFLYMYNPMGFYLGQVSRGYNNFRWIEYSITANIMAFIIAVMCGFRDGYTLLSIFAIVTGMMFTGMWFEHCLGVPAWVPILVGFILFGVFAFVIFRKFSDEIELVKESGVELPGWIYWVVIGTLLFYGVFGLVPVLKYLDDLIHFSVFLPTNWYEYTYLLLSLISKIFLGFFVGYGAFFATG